MPSTTGRLDLDAALEDTPHTQAAVTNAEASVVPIKDLTQQLKETCRTLQSQQMKVSETLTEFNRVLQSFNYEAQGDKDTFMLSAFQRLGSHVCEMQSWQEMLCTQLNHAVVDQFDSFLSNDLTKLESLKLAYEQSRSDHEQAMAKYARVSKKKETERSRFDANSDLFSARKSFFQSALHYYAELNNFQQKKKYAVLDPLLAFMHAQMAYFKMGHEILTDEVGRFLTSLNVEIQKVRSEHELIYKQQKKQFEALEQRAPLVCVPDPDPLDPFVEYKPPDLNLKSKAGYLFQKHNKWERAYYFTKEHLLYTHTPPKLPEVLMDLSGGQVVAETVDADDRRYVFQVVNDVIKKPLLFQAECAKIRDEWVAAINNVAKSPSQSRAAEGMQDSRDRTDSELIRLERQKIRSWVQQEMTPASGVGGGAKRRTSLKTLEKTGRGDGKPSLRTYSTAVPPRPPPPRKRGDSQSPQGSQVGNGNSRSAFASSTVQQLLELADAATQDTPHDSYMQSFDVTYLGSMEVTASKGLGIVTDAIRRIIAARALKNIMKKFNVNLVVTHQAVSLIDMVTGKMSVQFKLKDISYCAKHPDNHKLVGIISRTTEQEQKLVCHVFEANLSGKAICQAVIEAIRVAVKMVTEVQQPLVTMEQIAGADGQRSLEAEKSSYLTNRSIPKSLSTGSFRGPLETTDSAAAWKSDVGGGGRLFSLLESSDHTTMTLPLAPSSVGQQPLVPSPTTPQNGNLQDHPIPAPGSSTTATQPLETSAEPGPTVLSPITMTTTASTSLPASASVPSFAAATASDLQVFDPLTNTHTTITAGGGGEDDKQD